MYDCTPRFVHFAHHFTGKERDAESGLDYFGARYLSSSMGRWMSPDWADSPSPVPWAVFTNPQSLNLYSYVNNNPLSHKDADGHLTLCGPDTWNSKTNTLSAGQCTNLPDPQTKTEYVRQQLIAFHNWRPITLGSNLDPKTIEKAQWAVLLANFLARDLGLASDEVVDVTKPGSVENVDTKLTPDQFGAKLQDNGFTKSAASDGTPTYVKGDTQYTIYSNAKSTGGPTAQVKDNGSVVGKVRLK